MHTFTNKGQQITGTNYWQSDRLIPDTDQGGGFVVAVWTEQGKQLERPGKYRHVDALPCLDAWVEN